MFQQLKRLGTETAIYGFSTILGRFLNFLLVPFYTNVLVPGEYGIVAYVYSLIAFVNVIYSYGMESAYFKYSSTLEIGTQRQNFSTPFFSLFGTSVVFSFLLAAFISPVARIISVGPAHESIVLYTAGILLLDTSAIIPFAALRMEHKARLFATVKFLNIAINVSMNLLLLVVLKLGVEGVFISGLVASAATLVMLLPAIAGRLSAEFNPGLFKELLKFGLPYIPSGLAAMAIQVIDRPILRSICGDATVGIYQANYRLGIFMMLVVSMYDYAWRPFYFSTAKESNAKEIFARVLTYLVLMMSAIFLVLTFFIGDAAKITLFGRHIIGQNYWPGLNIVPLVLLGYLFLGITTNLSAGIYIQKKTKYAPLVTGIGALINIVSNFVMIPYFGMIGAAWATLFAYAGMAVISYIINQKVYPVRYEFSRLSKIAATAMLVLILYYVFPVTDITSSGSVVFLWKIFLAVLFIAILYFWKFLEPGELKTVKNMVDRFRSRKPDNGRPPAGMP